MVLHTPTVTRNLVQNNGGKQFNIAVELKVYIFMQFSILLRSQMHISHWFRSIKETARWAIQIIMYSTTGCQWVSLIQSGRSPTQHSHRHIRWDESLEVQLPPGDCQPFSDATLLLHKSSRMSVAPEERVCSMGVGLEPFHQRPRLYFKDSTSSGRFTRVGRNGG